MMTGIEPVPTVTATLLLLIDRTSLQDGNAQVDDALFINPRGEMSSGASCGVGQHSWKYY